LSAPRLPAYEYTVARVALTDLTKVFDDGTVAVDRVSFKVEDGEFVVLVGPSGCGKSTTLRLIAGLEEPSAGAIVIDGRVVNDIPPKERDIAMVFQNYALYPHLTVYENLAFGLRMQRLPRRQIADRVEAAAALLGLEGLMQRRPKALSGGERQRVALGRALVRQPRVFLFDEPLSNLDARLRVQMRAELIRLQAELAATVIYVTHDQVEAMTMGSRIVVLQGGRVQQVGSPLTLYEDPANRFVAGFIGSPAMNFVEGFLSGSGRGGEFVEQGEHWRLLLPLTLFPLSGETAARRAVTLGIRPEDVELVAAGEVNVLQARVEVVEPLGYDTLVTCREGPWLLVARAGPGFTRSPGSPVGLRLDPHRVRLFDAGSGERLAAGRAPEPVPGEGS
jgi:multiple sugar transport system ATP-binding protein